MLILLALSTVALARPSRTSFLEPRSVANGPEYQPFFDSKSQFDVVTVLLLLGESTIWKVIWTRFRFRRCHWRQWVYPISPGWTLLASSLFTALQSSRGPPNVIFDRPPVDSLTSGLILTNLNSGASHSASNVIIQNIWQAWYMGPRAEHRIRRGKTRDVTREVAVLDVDIGNMKSPGHWTLYLQGVCLATQMSVSLVLGFFGWSFETFAAFLVTFVAQALFLAAITPRHKAWQHRDLTVHRRSPVMIHKGMDSMGLLFVRNVTVHGKDFSLEEYCWESQSTRDKRDGISVLVAGASFVIFVFQIVLVGWMSAPSRLLCFILGGMGLLTNSIEGAFEPDWAAVYSVAFTGEAFCEPESSTLMAAVGILLAGGFSARESVSKLLYPDNERFQNSRDTLRSIFSDTLCASCRQLIKEPVMTACLAAKGKPCQEELNARVYDFQNKQIRDGIAAVCHYLRSARGDRASPRIITKGPHQQYSWKK
ncbi:hypothetical protein BDU57DRAFT_508983 [Ampelomyces quisqualis]|uniref:Uncharacterized protein n=1 Tax=Ampelomyces quisqualis TaxID=50730 RepID=A0A6A5QZE1_AMPQU|nr:hypothetical protein BDU57DRAFT_508983 [Ampelomyces quisqualis]